MNVVDALNKVGAPSTIARAFALMGVAEEEIACAKKRYPKKAKELDEAFIDLCPCAPMMEFGDNLYRAYAKERLEQIANNQSRSATNAEAVMVISRTSNKTPIHWEFTAAYWLAMCKMFGEKEMLRMVKETEDTVYTKGQMKEAQQCLDEVKNEINRRLRK